MFGSCGPKLPFAKDRSTAVQLSESVHLHKAQRFDLTDGSSAEQKV